MLQALFPSLRRNPPPRPQFTFGTLKLSEKVQWLDSKSLIDPLSYLQRHVRGDWGEVSETEHRANLDALKSSGVLASRYEITPRLTLTVLTNEARSLTVIQLPDEQSLF